MPGGNKNIKPEDGKPFSKDYQPSPEAKKEGMRRKRNLKELADAILSGKGLKDAKLIAKAVGIDLSDKEFTLEVIMTLKQVEKALIDGDTRAYSAAMDRLKGKPEQSVDMTSLGEKMQNPVTTVFTINHDPNSVFKEEDDVKSKI